MTLLSVIAKERSDCGNPPLQADSGLRTADWKRQGRQERQEEDKRYKSKVLSPNVQSMSKPKIQTSNQPLWQVCLWALSHLDLNGTLDSVIRTWSQGAAALSCRWRSAVSGKRSAGFLSGLDPRGFCGILTARFLMDKVIVAALRHCEERSDGLAMTVRQSGQQC